jgi:hypothetical protein
VRGARDKSTHWMSLPAVYDTSLSCGIESRRNYGTLSLGLRSSDDVLDGGSFCLSLAALFRRLTMRLNSRKPRCIGVDRPIASHALLLPSNTAIPSRVPRSSGTQQESILAYSDDPAHAASYSWIILFSSPPGLALYRLESLPSGAKIPRLATTLSPKTSQLQCRGSWSQA